MPTPEQPFASGPGEQSFREDLHPHHFYAAYTFDNPATRRRDITILIDQAQQLERPVRYWWLSEAMDLQGSPDRLIVCVHHPSADENAGMDLYDALEHHQAKWDGLEAADVGEYRLFGKIISRPDNIFEPDGAPLFPEPEDTEALFSLSLTRADMQMVAQGTLRRELTEAEMEAVTQLLPAAIGWVGSVEAALEAGQFLGRIGPDAAGHQRERKPQETSALFTLTRDDVQFLTKQVLDREATEAEMGVLIPHFRRVLNLNADFWDYLKQSIRDLQQRGQIGSEAQSHAAGEQEEDEELEARVRQLPNAGWPECYEDEHGHQCNAVHVTVGIDDEGQLYSRRDWGATRWGIADTFRPDNYTGHNWRPEFTLEQGDTLERALKRLDEMVRNDTLTPEDRARSEAFYRRLFTE